MSHPIIEFTKTPSEHHVQELFEQAKAVQARAYAPYSHFLVGAAILTIQGNIYVGCNVENAAYPVGNCAEASAIAAMIAGGEKDILALVTICDSSEVMLPRDEVMANSAAINATKMIEPNILQIVSSKSSRLSLGS